MIGLRRIAHGSVIAFDIDAVFDANGDTGEGFRALFGNVCAV
jgi:hypothetical protein